MSHSSHFIYNKSDDGRLQCHLPYIKDVLQQQQQKKPFHKNLQADSVCICFPPSDEFAG